MCLIVNNPQGKILHPVRIASAHKNNPDGVGVMWYDAEADRVHVERGMLNFADFWKIHESLEGVPHAIHFRWRTRGEIGANFCHPFQVLDKATDGVDLYMMHNGTLSGIETSGGKSDSQVFADRLRSKIAGWKNPMDVLHPHILRRMSKTIGGGNKLLFMGSGGKTVIVNAESGWFDDDTVGPSEIKTFDGVATPTWYSNQYSFSGLTPASWYTEPVAARVYPRRGKMTWTKENDVWVGHDAKDADDDEILLGDLCASAPASNKTGDDDEVAAYSQWFKDRQMFRSMMDEDEDEDTIPPSAAESDEDLEDSKGTHYVVSSTGAVELRNRSTGKLVREVFAAPKTKEEEATSKRAKRKTARREAKAALRAVASEKWTDVALREGYIRRRKPKETIRPASLFHSSIATAEKEMLKTDDGHLYSENWMNLSKDI
jgi:hypothetical protein